MSPIKYCNLCDIEFSKPYNFRRHLERIHCFLLEDYMETINVQEDKNTIYEDKNTIYEDRDTNYEDKTTNYKDKNTNYKDNTILRDIETKFEESCNLNNINSLVCNNCNKTFARKWNLKEHHKRCKGIVSLACEYCKKVLSCTKSKNRHLKTCKIKKEIDSRALSNKYNDDNSNIQNDNNSSSISQQTADTINNNIQQNNTTNNTTINNNYVLTFPDNGDNKFEFNIDHITNTIMKNLLKKVQDPYYKFNNFFDKLMDEPSNRIIKKTSPNTSYSQIHKGDGNWELGYDKDIYKTLTHHVTVAAFDKIDNIKKDVKLAKELYHNLMNFATYVEQVNEMDYDSSDYNDITSRIKLIIINLSKRWESQK